MTFQDYNGEDTSLQVREKKKRERVSVLPGSCAVLYPCDSSNASKTRVVLTIHVDPILMVSVAFFARIKFPLLIVILLGSSKLACQLLSQGKERHSCQFSHNS